MTLQQIFDWCNKKSYFSRDDDEIWAAINSAAHLLYKEVVLENKGYFIVFDTTDLVLEAGQEEYQLPATCQQIVRLREQVPGEVAWRVVNPAELNDPATTDAAWGFDTDVGADTSRFIYNGPYLKQSDAIANDEIYSIRIEPIPTETHNTELVFTADFLEIEGAESTLVIDPEGHDALKNLAVVELLDANDDDNRMNFLERGNYHTSQYLRLVRKRQIQQGPTIEPYLYDMD
jgi:hypothetical protein